MLTLSNLQKSDKLRVLLTSSKGGSDPMFGLLLADAFVMTANLS